MSDRDNSNDNEASGKLEIPHQELKPEVLRAIIEEFVLQEGTDYGHQEVSLEEKVAQVLRQLDNGKAVILFDQKEETCTIVASTVFRRC